MPSDSHYVGHAGAMLQARRLGTDLLVGIHSDDDILENKGPTVMNLKERSVVLLQVGNVLIHRSKCICC